MATKNRKDDYFSLLPFLELASVKYPETRPSRDNDFGQYFNLTKMKNLFRRFLKIVQFNIFNKKKEILR